MQAQFIYYKSTFMNLNLRHKRLDKTFIKKKKSTQSTQPNSRPNILSSIGLKELMDFIRLEFSHAEYVGLA